MKFLILSAVLFLSCSKADTQSKQEVKSQKEDLIDVVIIDVRTKSEFDSGHIEDALHIPYTEIAQKIDAVVKDKTKRIMLYCASGGRSEMALRTLQKKGFTNVTNEGGLRDIRKKLSQ